MVSDQENHPTGEVSTLRENPRNKPPARDWMWPEPSAPNGLLPPKLMVCVTFFLVV